MRIGRGNKSQDGLLASKLSGGKKDFDWSQLNPLNSKWLGGDRGSTPSQTWQNIKDAWGSDEDDSMVRHYAQAGGDAGGSEDIAWRSRLRGDLDKGPTLPYETAGVSEDLPEFVASQMERGPSAQQAEHGLDTEASRLKAGREFNPALASLDHQADPSLWEQTKTTASSIGSDVMGLFSSDEEAQVPAAVAQQPTTSPHGPASVAQQMGRADRHPDMPEPPPSLLAGKAWEQSGTGDHVGVDPEEGEGLMAKLGNLMSSDSPKTKPLSKSKQAGIKIATDLLTGGNRDAPVLAPSSGVKMGRASFPGLLAASKRPVNQRYTPKGLG